MNQDKQNDQKKFSPQDTADERLIDNDITPQELDMLDNAGSGDEDDEAMHEADLDSTDKDGTLLNEKASGRDRSGRDLDVPGSDNDNKMEDIGEEDEENNSYSLKDGDA